MFPVFQSQQKPDVVIETNGALLPLSIQVVRFRSVRMPRTDFEVENVRVFVQAQMERQVFHETRVEIPLITEEILNPRFSIEKGYREKETYPFAGYVVGIYGFQRSLLFGQGISIWTESTKGIFGKQILLARAYQSALCQMKNGVFEDPIDLYSSAQTLDRLAIAHYIGLKIKKSVTTNKGPRPHVRYTEMVDQQKQRLKDSNSWSQDLFTGEALFELLFPLGSEESKESPSESFVADLPTG